MTKVKTELFIDSESESKLNQFKIVLEIILLMSVLILSMTGKRKNIPVFLLSNVVCGRLAFNFI